MVRSRARRDRDGIVGPSMMASMMREAVGWCMNASCSCGISDSILHAQNQGRRVESRGWVLLRVVIFGSVAIKIYDTG